MSDPPDTVVDQVISLDQGGGMGGLPSKQIVNGADGSARARAIGVGDRLWTLDGDRTVHTAVVGVTAVKAREVVDVVTEGQAFTVAPDQLLSTRDGWIAAGEAEGSVVAWTPPRKLCRTRLTILPGYEFGYLVGATCADGTVGKNYASLVVNDEGFAAKYAECLTAATGLPARLEPVTRPSGFLQCDVPGFRVRVVSSYLADVLRQYVGGDAHHMRQGFPRVVLKDLATFEGFLDGYADGDGCRIKRWDARMIISANVPFLAELAVIIGARFTPRTGMASQLVVTDRWQRRGTFVAEEHPVHLMERQSATVSEVRRHTATGAKPFTLYTYRLEPHAGFLVSGHLVRAPR
ncbi:hypothetical protein OG898_09835 [Streptomyces sp. NBC_00193]|uniref:hypothetical protein n=1 Tax=Streptomyces sp. NBC_00193 TaxID=2975675 RepID=UPI0022555CEC|nr:hypothetical protein [Streptomyces sp. NBC_00193]MCX5296789.1 hypothetical protein [Streptomyces sp. NBC_00193]